ncbi:CPA2 family monovalent cation:H+ antiporter-2/glutathione-regulated potassium-efflux system protein KefB [Chitinophaga dinghuensis]|uniref:CPA2 family monovalent cation:H+ antiporter-2/glutathione-regulated potassium-efflux system protein KefB n=1 Tax=Chitinophaga dinghuensis TaxID=1539050 RepID=A0A327W738_9BACT|nr:monovalent cation:proton antiporter-2 (CPA2) family protein [Chitinophaga dinghuensis]RAJ85308.1 CPA2 family monovalent cation:H+ antiporter-2/glutathione-regulated potassium-efflux system protein KefB [Chitinophaga dinghuensis]
MDQHSLLFQSMVYLAAAILFVPLAKKMGLGAVLGYLLAGVIIGPSVAGFIGKEGEDIMHFAEFGVVMMLFLIGMELEPALLWRLRSAILGLGGLQVVLSTAAIAGAALLLKVPLSAALAIGMIMSLSSTAIVLQTLNEKGWMPTAAGQSSFAVLLFQDIAVIPMLAIFPLLAVNAVASEHSSPSLRDNLPAWGQTLVVLGAVTAIIFAGRYLVRPIMHIIARTRVRELFTATALLMVVAIAVLMNLVGLSSALGAFLGGVVLANSEYRHELESDIEPFKGLLLGLFFIAVGASIDFGLIREQPWLIFGLVIGLMTIKTLVLLGLGKLFKLSTDQNLLFSFALCDIGEFAFVLLSISLQSNILDKQTTGILTAVVAISMAMTPLLMLLYEKLVQPRFTITEKSTRKADEIQDEHNPVIIAGFGRFGSITGRFLRANGIKATILDMDSDRVDALHKLGIKVYYGDASRYDLLVAAGAAKAKVLIIAMDDYEKTTSVVRMVKKYFPNLQMLVRAKDIEDTFELMDLGVLHIYRETVDTSLRLGADALEMLGVRAYHSHRAARTFLRQDEKSIKGLSATRDDKKEFVSALKERIEEMEKLIASDKIRTWLDEGEGWDSSGIRDEATGEPDVPVKK